MLVTLRQWFAKPNRVKTPTEADAVVPEKPSYTAIAGQLDKPVLSGMDLINLLQLSARVEQIRDLMGLPSQDWDSCCLQAIYNFAEAVQLAPASEVHHHAFCGGLLVHTLDAAIIALKLRRRYTLPTGATAERISEAGTRWTYAVLCAVLLHDPGKVGATVCLMARVKGSTSGEGLQRWSPLNGTMLGRVESYQIRFESAPYRLHNQVGSALFSALIPEVGRQWLSSDRELLTQLLTAVSDVHAPGSGVIGELLVQSDGESVAKDLGHPKPKLGQVTGAQATPLVDKYMRTLRQLIADGKFGFNKPGAQIFVVRKKSTPEAHADVWMLCRAVGDAVVRELRAVDPSVPTAVERFYDTLQEHGICRATPADKAIWTANVHFGGGKDIPEWHAEFSMLRFEAHKLFAPGKVPQPMAGSVKVKKLGQDSAHKTGADVQPARTSTPESDAYSITEPDVHLMPTTESELHHSTASVPSAAIDVSKALSALFAPVAKMPKTAPVVARTPGSESNSYATTAPEANTSASVPRTTAASVSVEVEHKIDLGNRFFKWLREQLASESADINSPSATIHIHKDGVLLVSPAIFKEFAAEHWLEAQKAAMATGYLLSRSRRNVFEYTVRSPKGPLSKTALKCAVLLPQACKALGLNRLTEFNPAIVGQA
jgi:integrating conjugative element relaxase (TIGR03760 family)